ncbi:MAG: 2-C-methyl-D-erythritol 2,4-cyclodiphosphate synthase [Phycisphaerae bacterium]
MTTSSEPIIHRVGLGTDIHRLVPDRPLVLGGVAIDHPAGLAGHSDADAVLHAVTDAVLGAAGLPDIGELFSDRDPANRDADSATFLRQAVRLAEARGYRAACADVVIQAELPMLSRHKPAIRARIAKLLGLAEDRVSIKAKTGEGLDAVGRGEAIACLAIVGLTHRDAGARSTA